MQKSYFDISHSEFYPKIIYDYLNGNEKLKPFYRYSPSISSFKKVLEDFSKIKFNRKLLVEVLQQQYSFLPPTPASQAEVKYSSNIQLLLNENSFTVCTGHQLCLFTGPLYFIYKIISTINLAEKLKENFPGYDFIPIYWMASEDHDFEEINHIHLFGKKIEWASERENGMKMKDHLSNMGKIPAGKISTYSIDKIINELKNMLGENENARYLIKIFSGAYLKNKNLAEATRVLVHELFGKYGLLIIDGNDRKLKSEFSEIIYDDLLNASNHKLVNETIDELNKLSYKHQVNPREINLFYLAENNRIRIEEPAKKFLDEIKTYPEKFSPNVVLRPLYQQKILPNLAYVGGPNEIAYWLEYKKMFDHHGINFPMLILRNSVMWIDERSDGLMKKTGISEKEIFEDTDSLIKKIIGRKSGEKLHLNNEKENLRSIFDDILQKAGQEDASLKPSVEAELQRIFHFLEQLEKKMLKAEKKKNETVLNQVRKMKEKLFPGDRLQERYENFIPYYLKYGENFFEILKGNLDPFENRLLILKEDSQ